MNKTRSVFLLLWCLTLSDLNAQYAEKDARLWLYLKLNANVTSRLKAELNFQNRINNNFNDYSQFNINLELNYKMNNFIKLTGGFVQGKIRQLDGYYNSRQQAYLGVNLRYRIHRFIFIYRSLVQAQTVNWYIQETFNSVRYHDRNKFTVKYDISKRLQAYVAEEFTFLLYRLEEIGLSRYRGFVGAKYDLSTSTYLEAYFMFQAKRGLKGPQQNAFIYGLTYSYTF